MCKKANIRDRQACSVIGYIIEDAPESTCAYAVSTSLMRGRLKTVWQHEVVRDSEGVGVRFELRSPDGEEGFPGDLTVVVGCFRFARSKTSAVGNAALWSPGMVIFTSPDSTFVT